ncbi:MAG: hypothetical protein HKN19_03540 [Halioglobus sp.]|nr:hypothetical protein [Halioglobus sp.]
MRVNELELRLVSVMRSGNHTVIEWILSLYPREKLCFLDTVAHGAHDPYTNARDVLHLGFDDDAPLDEVRNARKRLLLYSYEDRPNLQQPGHAFLDSVFDTEFEMQREGLVGASDRQRNVIVLRDPFSCLAGRLMVIRERAAKGGSDELKVIGDNWKALARRAVQQMDDEKGDIVILYNRWTCDQAYRKKIAATLAGHYSEERFRNIIDHSHARPRKGIRNRLRRTYRALRMKVARLMAWVSRSRMPVLDSADETFQRWHFLRRDEQFRNLFRDQEILELCEQLFGDIPGARRFVNQVNKKPLTAELPEGATASPEA